MGKLGGDADRLLVRSATLTGTVPYGACSDGINLWIPSQGNLLRF